MIKMIVFAGLLILGSSFPVLADAVYARKNPVLEQTRIDQRLGEMIPLDLAFEDSDGRPVRLGEFFKDKPVLLTPVYYSCPMLCNLILNGLVKSLKTLKFTPGEEFEIVTFSINPAENPDLAAAKKENYLKDYGRPQAAEGWHFLTGSPDTVRQLTEAIGFRYQYDPASREYAHAAAVMVLTPEGKLSHYFYGIDFSPKDLRLALIESAQKRIGSFADQVLLLCYHYDPSQGKYGLAVMSALRAAGMLTVAILVSFIVLSLRKEHREKAGTK